jgi:hypothetical protein
MPSVVVAWDHLSRATFIVLRNDIGLITIGQSFIRIYTCQLS